MDDKGRTDIEVVRNLYDALSLVNKDHPLLRFGHLDRGTICLSDEYVKKINKIPGDVLSRAEAFRQYASELEEALIDQDSSLDQLSQ